MTTKITVTNKATINDESFLIDQYVIVRGYDAGVRAGKLISQEHGKIILEDARQLWRRWAEKSIGLSGLSKYGLADRDEVMILAPHPRIMITDTRVGLILPCTEEVEKQLRNYKIAEQK